MTDMPDTDTLFRVLDIPDDVITERILTELEAQTAATAARLHLPDPETWKPERLIEHLAARVEQLEAANRWIPVSERLPEESEEIYFVLGSRWANNPEFHLPWTAHFHGEWVDDLEHDSLIVSFWRPAPKNGAALE